MNLPDLVKAAGNAIQRGGTLTLVLPGWSKTNTMRLVKGRGKCPMGEVVCDSQSQDGKRESVCVFDPVEVLAYLTAKGLVEVVAAAETPK